MPEYKLSPELHTMACLSELHDDLGELKHWKAEDVEQGQRHKGPGCRQIIPHQNIDGKRGDRHHGWDARHKEHVQST